jgi:hypothetical protein
LNQAGVRLLGLQSLRGLFLFLPCILLIACEAAGWQDSRRTITDEGALRITVRVRMDWNRAGLEPETPDGRITASVWFFPDDDSERLPYVMTTDEIVDSISLPPGRYHILAFNGLLEYSPARTVQNSASFQHIGFRGTERYETFEAFCRTPLILSSRYSRAPGDVSAPMAAPEMLAADHYRDAATGDVLSLTTEMVDKDIRPTLNFVPVPIVAMLRVVVHVQNLISAATIEGANIASVNGLAESVFLASGRKGTALVAHYFNINHRQFYENSETDGTLRGESLTFGLLEEEDGANVANMLGLYFTLRDGYPLPVMERDITGRLEEEEQIDGKIQLTFYVEVGTGVSGSPNDPDPPVELPTTPDTGGAGSEFDVEIDSWGDNIIFDLDL